jgi:hypothetical protein
MSMKRVAAAAAVAAGLGASVTVFHAGFANSVPCPAWQHDKTCDPPPANQGPGFGGGSTVPNPGPSVPGAGTTRVTTLPPQFTTTPHVTTGPGPTTDNKITTTTTGPTSTPWTGSTTQSTTTTPWSGSTTQSTTTTPWSGSTTQSTTTTPWSGSTTQSTTTTPWSGSTTQPGGSTSYSTPTTTRPVLNAPWNQPPHPPYIPPHGDIPRGTAQYGGPIDLKVGFYLPGRGAPPPPRQRGYGWSDGPAPGQPPPNWYGPPPPGGWDGAPPAGGWNRPWVGPPRYVDYGQRYFAPFTYNTFTVLPVFNWLYGGWGYWFFGVWVPLY